MKVGIKYCGGCRAGYDRVALVNRLKNDVAGAVDFVGPDDPEAEMVLFVSGCKSACTSIDQIRGRAVRFVTSEEDAEHWIREVLENIQAEIGRIQARGR
ncbi:MAG TPA: hypothetical protein PLS81_04065 [Deltaproteobacteria bacterium]|nr:hypothetical protein [Deltaproteobacteria bacterium]HOM28618.1 hypothetical protein [Deltaproteobacteria bacterium]HPP79890.1 hypothetical protein [Deltaproteobacteria bacterium]